jgi:CRP-like cAMP-binding protein
MESGSVMASNRLQYLTANDWVLISAKAKRLTFGLGEEIIKEGAPSDSIYVIRSGEASVELTGTDSTTVVAMLKPEDICGDMAFLERSSATAAVIARDVLVEVDAIRADDLRELFESFAALGARFYHSLALVLARRLRETSKQLAREKASRKPEVP